MNSMHHVLVLIFKYLMVDEIMSFVCSINMRSLWMEAGTRKYLLLAMSLFTYWLWKSHSLID